MNNSTRRGILSSGCKDTTFFNRIGIVLAFKENTYEFFGNTYMFFDLDYDSLSPRELIGNSQWKKMSEYDQNKVLDEDIKLVRVFLRGIM